MRKGRFVVVLFVLAIALGTIAAPAQRLGGYREIDKSDEGAAAAAEFCGQG
ncbi:MAG TPA: hypothetical protein VHQ64_03330 [Pyrinomonadaceae bacterium]|jgi:hypothetical protein|nr:hypothetical protein [Pyrinomonadaceae bacterium]